MKLLILNKKTLLFLMIILIILLIVIPLIVLNWTKTEDVFKEDIFYQGIKDEKVVSFACNIDWGNESIEDMLNIFKDRNINITFFPTGKWAEKNPKLLKNIYDDGHEIGNHGYSHVDYDKLSLSENIEQIKKADSIIKNIIGEKPIYFAPPSGAFSDSTIKAADDLDYKTIMWSVDTIDWREDSTEDVIVERVLSNIHNSAIVLMHPTEETNKALPKIIESLLKQGYNIGRISDIL
ncbi:MAG TPA: polysaccharide deacetylase family protein [Tissierellaceae bacterium]|nr:polysaccharide deacetylase family protein [Tissierellaceae bacterium]